MPGLFVAGQQYFNMDTTPAVQCDPPLIWPASTLKSLPVQQCPLVRTLQKLMLTLTQVEMATTQTRLYNMLEVFGRTENELCTSKHISSQGTADLTGGHLYNCSVSTQCSCPSILISGQRGRPVLDETSHGLDL